MHKDVGSWDSHGFLYCITCCAVVGFTTAVNSTALYSFVKLLYSDNNIPVKDNDTITHLSCFLRSKELQFLQFINSHPSLVP